MKQPHIQLDESLNVRYAILPGDPRRAERIASHMSEVEDLGMNREYRSLVGAYRGARILAMSTGMGGVSTGIAVEELHNIGVTHAIRIGSCGALQTDIAPGELLIAAGAVRDDGTSRAYVREGYPAVPDTELLLALTESIRAQGFAHRLGIIRSHESFYIDDIEEINEYWSKKGVLGSDMETAALLTVGRLRGMKCASVLNNVVRWKECISHGVGSYAASADAAAVGEEHSILAALEAFARLEAEKKLEKTGTFSSFQRQTLQRPQIKD